MSKLSSIFIDFLCLFIASLVAQIIIFGSALFNTPWATWKQAIASAIVSALIVVAAAVNPTVKRYGIGSK